MKFYNSIKRFFLIVFVLFSYNQVQATIFFDDDGNFSRSGYVFTTSALVTATSAGYLIYKYWYNKKTNQLDEQQNKKDLPFFVDFKTLLCGMLSLQVSSVAVIEASFDEYVHRPKRKANREKEALDFLKKIEEEEEIKRFKVKKIADDAIFAKFLENTPTDAFKRKNNISSDYSKLSEQQKIDLLQLKLAHYPIDSTIKIPLIARLIVDFNYEKCVCFINKVVEHAIRSDKKILGIDDFQLIQDDIQFGPVIEDENICKNFDWAKYHEAGHAVVAGHLLSKQAVYKISVIVREKARRYTDFENQKLQLDVYSGHVQLIKTCKQDKIDVNDFEKLAMVFAAGAVAEQIKIRKMTEPAYDYDFLSYRSAQDDREKMKILCRNLSALACNKDQACLERYNMFGESVLAANQEKYMKDIYEKTFYFMLEKDKQDQIEQVYHELTKYKVLPGAKVYEIIGKERPKYDFEK